MVYYKYYNSNVLNYPYNLTIFTLSNGNIKVHLHFTLGRCRSLNAVVLNSKNKIMYP